MATARHAGLLAKGFPHIKKAPHKTQADQILCQVLFWVSQAELALLSRKFKTY